MKQITVIRSLAAVLFLTCITPAGFAQAPKQTIWNGVYTDAQAERGRAAYELRCDGCHQGDLSPTNQTARMAGPRFFDRWREESLDYMYDFIYTTMPRRKPKSLPESDYLDIVAHILKVNSVPAGERELTREVVRTVRFEQKDGPKPLPGGSLAQTVGCLQVDPDERWNLVQATEPVRTRTNTGATHEELIQAEETPAGSLTFRLTDLEFVAKYFRPLENIGRKLLIKGVLVRQTNRDRLSIRTVQALESVCEP